MALLAALLPATAGAVALPAPTAPEDVAVAAQAAQSYAAEHGVSLAVANDRLKIQSDTAPILDRVAAAVGSDYAGAWYDANDGGRLKIGVASPQGTNYAPASDVLAAQGVQADADFVHVRSSWDDLVAAQRSLGAQFGDLLHAGLIDTKLDPSANAVIVETSASVADAQRRAVQAAAAAVAPVTVEVRAVDRPDLVAEPTSCSFQSGSFSSSELFCDPPLRGGVMISGGGYGCSAGFLVAGSFDYLMTAGHCDVDNPSSVWQTRFADTSLHNIGYSSTHVFGSGGDYGLISISNPSGWSVASTVVWVDGVPGQTTQDSSYAITGSGHAALGATICGSSGILLSNGYHSACGSVTALNVTVTYTGGTTVQGLGQSNACMGTGGSSGGPYYKDHIGYGIQSGAYSSCNVLFQGLSGALSGTATHLLP